MIVTLKSTVAVLSLLVTTAAVAAPPAGCNALLDQKFPELLSGKPHSLCEFAGKVVLVVNTASQCGYTPQYEGLEALYKRYQKRGLVVIGFPSNDFGGQEPADNRQVAEFCKLNYGVSFPMFEKTVVSGPQANPFYTALARSGGGAPRWNFHKYLIDRSGNRVVGYGSATEPGDAKFVREIEKLLAEPAAAKPS
jgi:glutathione peroxidase